MHGYLRHIANFAYVIEAGSISGAASRLQVSASVISDSVRILENHFGEPLVERHRSGISPTSRGAELYVESSKIVSSLGRAMHVAPEDRVEGMLTITMPQEVADNGFHRVMMRLEQQYPKLRLSILVEDGLTDHNKHARDLFLRVGFGGAVDGLTQLWSKLLKIVLVAHPDLLNGISPTDTEQLSKLPYLCNLRNEPHIDVQLANPDQTVRFEKTYQTNSHQTRLTWARTGVGIVACLSTSVEDDLKHGSLIELFPERNIRKGMMHLLSNNKKITPRETAIAEILYEILGGDLGETRQ